MSLATLGSKNHTTNITKIVTQSIGIIIKRLYSVVSQRESVKNDKPTISMSLSHCIHQTLNSKASTRFHSGGLQQSRSEERRVGKECRCRWCRYQSRHRRHGHCDARAAPGEGQGHRVFFFKQKTAYEVGLGIPAEPLFRSNRSSANVRVSKTINQPSA